VSLRIVPNDRDDEPVDDWLRNIAGRQDQRGDPSAADAGKVMRRRLEDELSAVRNAGLDGADSEERAVQQLRFKLRREGIGLGRPSRRPWWAAAAAAGLAAAVLLPTLWPPHESDDPWLRVDGAPPGMRSVTGTLELRSSDRQGDARAIAAALHGLGAQPIVYVEPDRTTVIFVLEQGLVDKVEREVLAPRGLKRALAGENRIVIR
jgi:hypothetical protein